MRKILSVILIATCSAAVLKAQDNDSRIRIELEFETRNQLEETLPECEVSYEVFKVIDLATCYRITFLEDNKKAHVAIKRLKFLYRLRFTNYTDFYYEPEDKSNCTQIRLMLKYDFRDFHVTPFISHDLCSKHFNDHFNKTRYSTCFMLSSIKSRYETVLSRAT
ncbi:hypothetical protein OU798_19165 [Prolixibacteraceae bacterium Z1-6]|uniref:Uncharacterized protein n=1 Tax=Draconibacterium aestuarii TaxID=2998507 RepID=A0A9X3F8J8_9BACT|nr:hypothetical protein [Prolixibacteraceae bacterium Z1-6]